MKSKLLFFSTMLFLSQAVTASDAPNEIDLLKQQIKLLTERIDQLENRVNDKNKELNKDKEPNKRMLAVKNEVSKTASLEKTSISDRLSFKADFRERYEIIDQEGKVTRDRNRVRLRAALSMKLDEDLSFTLGMATGGDDPVSTNQTLDGAFSTKDIRLDLAYFDYQINDILKLTGGKMKNPFYIAGKNASFWDSDLNPEGLALIFDTHFLQGRVGGFAVEERNTASDSYLLGVQVMHGFKLLDKAKLNVGAGYYNYSNLKGNATLLDSKARGNTVDINGNYVNDYDIAEFFVEYKTKISGQPLSFFANYFNNTAADELDTAYTYGIKYGKVKGFRTWDIGLTYLNTEADSVIGLFNDSDFAGGNTDAKGVSLKAGYGLRENIKLGLTYINSEFGQSKVSQTNYERLQLDLKLKFK